MVESFKRYYHNSFLDSQRQEAYNLFLGNYIWAQGQPMLWDLQTDYYLHHADPRVWSDRVRRNYVQWYTPRFLEPRTLPNSEIKDEENIKVEDVDDYWQEYYRPLAVSSFLKIFSFRMNTNVRHLPDRLALQGNYDLSPFIPRKVSHDPTSPEKKAPRKGVTIVDPQENNRLQAPEILEQPRHSIHIQGSPMKQSILRDFRPMESSQMTSSSSSWHISSASTFQPGDRTQLSQWTLNQFYSNSLNPSVTADEAEEYKRYIGHPLNLPLVVSTETPHDFFNPDFVDYVAKASGEGHTGDEEGLWEVGDEDVADYTEFLRVEDNPLTVNEEDGDKKRYKAYRQWLRGKSLFKQSKVDPEYRA
jgi:phosphatidylinositol 3,5-bisphosphate 5-phosphatase